MVAEGVTGPLCWAVSLHQYNDLVHIGSAPAPASPTEEDLAAAKQRTLDNLSDDDVGDLDD